MSGHNGFQHHLLLQTFPCTHYLLLIEDGSLQNYEIIKLCTVHVANKEFTSIIMV